MSVLVLTTGGTIGALAHPDPAKPPVYVPMPPDGRDLVAEVLTQPEFQFIATRCLSLEPRDSKDIDDAYREHMLALITAAAERQVLMTYGTDRLLQAAEWFYYRRESYADKIMILTGAMTPLANRAESDGYKNLRFALRAFAGDQALAPGQIYIVLCGHGPAGWQPQLYPFAPGRYEKVFADDGRYNYLKLLD